MIVSTIVVLFTVTICLLAIVIVVKFDCDVMMCTPQNNKNLKSVGCLLEIVTLLHHIVNDPPIDNVQ